MKGALFSFQEDHAKAPVGAACVDQGEQLLQIGGKDVTISKLPKAQKMSQQVEMVDITQNKEQMQRKGELEVGVMWLERREKGSDPCHPGSVPLSCPVPTAELIFAAAPLPKDEVRIS